MPVRAEDTFRWVSVKLMYSSYMIKPRSTAKVISGLSENHTPHALLFKVKQGINVKTKKSTRQVQANVFMLKFTSQIKIIILEYFH